MKVRYLTVYVYRTPALGDCTNKGISSRFNKLLLACPDGPNSFDADLETPLNFCKVEKRELQSGVYCTIVPATVSRGRIVKRPGWWMMGGNLAHSSDCRFNFLTGTFYPLAIHDRQE